MNYRRILNSTGINNNNTNITIFIVVFGLIIYLFGKKFISSITTFFGLSKISEKNLVKDVEQISFNSSNLSFTENQAKILANRLFNAMNQYGTNEGEIFSVFNQIKNPDDMKAVYRAFGVVNYDMVKQGWFAILSDVLDLNGWLIEELSTSDYNKIKTKLSWI